MLCQWETHKYNENVDNEDFELGDESQSEMCMGEVPGIVSNFNSQGCFAEGEGEGIQIGRAHV